MKNNKGFTLMEVLVVIFIIAILVAIIIPSTD
jgi:prepilin-type N-terminal cleavage/methylation domain-containing protein